MKTKLIALSLLFASNLIAGPVVVLPDYYKGNKVVVENSEEYLALIKDNKTLIAQLDKEKSDFKTFSDKIEKQRTKNHEIQSDLVNAYNKEILASAKKDTTIVKKELALIGHRVVIVLLIGVIAAGIYLRMKGIL